MRVLIDEVLETVTWLRSSPQPRVQGDTGGSSGRWQGRHGSAAASASPHVFGIVGPVLGIFLLRRTSGRIGCGGGCGGAGMDVDEGPASGRDHDDQPPRVFVSYAHESLGDRRAHPARARDSDFHRDPSC